MVIGTIRKVNPELHTSANRRLCESFLRSYFDGRWEDGHLVWGYQPRETQHLKGQRGDFIERIIMKVDVEVALRRLRLHHPYHARIICLYYQDGKSVKDIAREERHHYSLISDWKDEGLDFLIDELWTQ